MSTNRIKGLWNALDSSVAVAAALVVTFYVVVHQPAMHGSLLHRYTTEHIVDYVIVSLFMWGIVDIVFKLLSFPRELVALRYDWLPPREGREPASVAQTLLAAVQAQPQWLQDSRVGKRLISALQHVVDTGSAEEYREHLTYLSDQDEDHTTSNYTLIRFVIGVTPVLGFLGTVVHFGTALSGISFDEMATKLPVVVGEMGQAFNTTTVALAAAMSMMFCLFFCERIENRIVGSINRLVERELLTRFEIKDENIRPFLSIVQNANDAALQAINRTLEKQIEVWSESLAELFQRFEARQSNETHQWEQALAELQHRHEELDERRDEYLQRWLGAIESRQDKFAGHIHATLEKAVSLRDDFSDVLETLHTVAKGEGKLVELQTTLTNNLRVLHETHQIDEALHGLSAAIHLLTSRHDTAGSKAISHLRSAS